MAIHDMSYFGGEVITIINHTLDKLPTIDRGCLRVWNISETSSLLLDMNDTGSLEFHQSSDGWSTFRSVCSPLKPVEELDYRIDEDAISSFLNKYCKQ